MNKNTIIGTLLLIVLFMGMTWWNGKNASEREQARRELKAKQDAEREIGGASGSQMRKRDTL